MKGTAAPMSGFCFAQKMNKSLGLTLVLAILCVAASATTPVSGTLKDAATNTVSAGAFVRARLLGCQGNQPRVNGTALIPPRGSSIYYVDFAPDSSGVISGTLFSTRDAAGTGNGEIQCGTSYTSAYYSIQVYFNGVPGPEIPVHAKNGVTLDITNATPITTNPVVTAPTGDTTYCRIDGGNCGFTGPITSTSSIKARRIEDVRQFDGAGFTTEDAAITDCSTGPCLVQVSPAQAQSSATSYPKNVSLFNFRTGTAATPLTNQDSGDWNISLRRHDATVNYGALDKLLFGGPSQGGGVARFEFNAPAANVDQAFGVGSWIYCGTAPPTNPVTVTNVKVGIRAYSFRGTGAPNCGTMGANVSTGYSIDSSQGDISLEVDHNNAAQNYSITSTAASKDGIVSASGGNFRPRWAYRDGATNGTTNEFDGGMLLSNWYTKGFVSKPTAGAGGSIAIESQYIGTAATSLGTQTNSGDICAMANRWTGSAAAFPEWCWRAVPRGDGTGSHFDLINPQNGTANIQVFDSFNGQAAVFGSGILAAQLPGSVTITSFDTTAPGLRLTPLNDTAGNAICVTNAANSVNSLCVSKAGKLYTVGGVDNTGTGITHKRVAGCATAASLAATCTTTVTWATAIGDTSYSVSCTGDLVTSGVPLNGGITAKASGSVTFQTVAGTAAAAQYTNIDCIAMHD